jgi:hypothetical protein
MNYWRCRCGKTQAWESGMSPAGCRVCAECGSTLGTGPGHHLPQAEHRWELRRLVRGRTEVWEFEECAGCHARRGERLVLP